MKFIDACRKFISIDSSQSQGNSDLVEFAAELCRDAGLNVEIQEEMHQGRPEKNIIARPAKEPQQGELLLQTHLDTADPGIFSLWTKTSSNPFNASIYGDTLYGLGSADVKLDFLCKLEAVKRVLETHKSPNLVLVGTYGAESGMSGAVKLIRRSKIKANRALIGQPTEMKLVNGSSGIAVVEISIPFSEEETDYHQKHDLMLSSSCQSKMFYGEAGHSAHPQLKENAIVAMMDYLSQLPEGIAVLDMEGGASFNSIPESSVLEFDLMGGFKQPTVASKISSILKIVKNVEKEFNDYPSEGFEPNIPTLNIGTVKKMKEHLRFTGCFRFTPNVHQETYEQWMQSINKTCEDVGASFRIVDYKQAFNTGEDTDFSKIAMQALKETHPEAAEFQKISVCTEASVFHRLGIECLVMGAGRLDGNSYEPDECISIENLQKSIDFYQKVIESTLEANQ